MYHGSKFFQRHLPSSMSLHRATSTGQIQGFDRIALPQPTIAVDSYDLSPNSFMHRYGIPAYPTFDAGTSHGVSYPYDVPEVRHEVQFPCQPQVVEPLPVSTTDVRESGEGEEVEEIMRGILELYQKLPARVREQLKCSIMNIAAISGQKSLNVGWKSTRGLHEPGEESSHKLERFKIRTVVGGVVKVEGAQTQIS